MIDSCEAKNYARQLLTNQDDSGKELTGWERLAAFELLLDELVCMAQEGQNDAQKMRELSRQIHCLEKELAEAKAGGDVDRWIKWTDGVDEGPLFEVQFESGETSYDRAGAIVWGDGSEVKYWRHSPCDR